MTDHPAEGARAGEIVHVDGVAHDNRARRDLAVLLITTLTSWTGQRTAAIALPLVALSETGSAWAIGLVGGVAGVPLVTAPWWAARLRHRLTSGRALAVVLAVQASGIGVVPVAAGTGDVGVVHLGAAGVVSGAAAALFAPAHLAMLAETGDRLGPRTAVRVIAWNDFVRRTTMVFAPLLAAWAYTQVGGIPLLWAETLALMLCAALLLTIRTQPTGAARRAGTAPTSAAFGDDLAGTGAAPPPDNIRELSRRHPDIATGIVIDSIAGLTWFALPLGLAVLGDQIGRGGDLAAAALAGYGIGSLAGSALAPAVVTRLSRLRTLAVAFSVFGTTLVLLPTLAPHVWAIGVVGGLGAFGMPIGISALNALIVERTSGAERRTAFAANVIAYQSASSVGLLVGGGVIGVVGP
ncbi:MAG: MFS transporter, partial [Dermatophilaceae bacterium]